MIGKTSTVADAETAAATQATVATIISISKSKKKSSQQQQQKRKRKLRQQKIQTFFCPFFLNKVRELPQRMRPEESPTNQKVLPRDSANRYKEKGGKGGTAKKVAKMVLFATST